MTEPVDTAMRQARALRYLTKDQAAALVDEIERLRQEVAVLREPPTNPWQPDELAVLAWERYVTVLEERHMPTGLPSKRRLHCDLCGATSWQPIVWMATAR